MHNPVSSIIRRNHTLKTRKLTTPSLPCSEPKDGEGSGEVGKLTVFTPILLRSYLKTKAVRGFPDGVGNPAAHISDVANFFGLLAGAIVSPSPPTPGYWFPSAHNSSIPKMEKAYAKALHARGLVDDPEPSTWSSVQEATEDLGVPEMYIPLIFHST